MRELPIRKMVFWPAVITLGVTLLRLAGELLHWSPALFNPQAGGGGALVGISWLPPVFGMIFGIQLARTGHGPASGARAIGLALAGIAATVGLMFGAGAVGLVQPGVFSLSALAVMTVAIAIGAAIAWAGWPALGRTLFAYGLAARIPVAIVMLVAMMGNWNTHYDVAPPGFPEMGVFAKWVRIGLFPQLTTWVAITILFGAVFGAVAGAIAARSGTGGASQAAA